MSPTAQLSQYINDAQRVVVFTGAGMSTESGIPDFRSPGGVWSKMTPIMFDDFCSSRDARREAWTRVYNGVTGWTGASPNSGHLAIAELAKSGKVSAIITQNVDNLHQASGAPLERIIELHGNASYAKCLECEFRYELEDLRPLWEEDADIVCNLCHGLIKSATISFGQPMPEHEMVRAARETLACDLFLVLGSSLAVYPAATLPAVAKKNGAKLAIVNREATQQDALADLVINDEIGAVLANALPH